MAQEWDIKERSQACHDCKTAFQDKQPYYSALVFRPEGYVRGDYCAQCWTGINKDETVPYSQWQGVFRPPPPPPEEALKKETAESLLRRLLEQDDGTKRNVMYILAVMLERKRILAEKDVQKHDDGSKVIVYEHKKTGETFIIPDPGLKLDQLEHVQREVVEMLGVRKPAAGTDGQTPVPATSEGQPKAEETPKDSNI
jgi:hypothetical protein